jgi:hypothetical protein
LNYKNVKVFQECQEEDHPFKPQILIAISGCAANADLDDSKVHVIACLEFPPTRCLDVKQEKVCGG